MKKSGLSINPDIYHSKVFSSVKIKNQTTDVNSTFVLENIFWSGLNFFNSNDTVRSLKLWNTEQVDDI